MGREAAGGHGLMNGGRQAGLSGNVLVLMLCSYSCWLPRTAKLYSVVRFDV